MTTWTRMFRSSASVQVVPRTGPRERVGHDTELRALVDEEGGFRVSGEHANQPPLDRPSRSPVHFWSAWMAVASAARSSADACSSAPCEAGGAVSVEAGALAAGSRRRTELPLACCRQSPPHKRKRAANAARVISSATHLKTGPRRINLAVSPGSNILTDPGCELRVFEAR